MRGFTLPELLIALALSSLLLLSSARLLPMLQLRLQVWQAQATLHDDLEQLADLLEKQLRRAGYCRGRCAGKPLHLARHCLGVRWDHNSNGRWEEEEFFQFRLREGALETRRGGVPCQGGGWERLSDPAAIALRDILLLREPGGRLRLRLAAVARRDAARLLHSDRDFSGINL